MKDYLGRLVERLTDSERPLSRNRHFDTFDNPQGRRALRISRQLSSLARDIVEHAREGAPVRVEHVHENGVAVRVQLEMQRLKVRRTAFLSPEEYRLLLRTEGVSQALGIQPCAR